MFQAVEMPAAPCASSLPGPGGCCRLAGAGRAVARQEEPVPVNVLFLSPHFPPQYHLFCRALADEGVTVLGLADAPPEALAPELADVLDDYCRVPDMSRYDDVLKAVAGLIHRHGRIDRIDSLNEHWLELEAQLREDFNVPGQRPADTARNRSKSAMRETFHAAGVPCSEGERYTSADQARSLARKFGYPLVFKPDVGVGAAHTFRVDSDAALNKVLEQPLDGFVIERFERGRLTSYDGLTGADGRIVYATSHIFSTGIMDIVNNQLTMDYYSRRSIPPLLVELGRKVVAAFGVRERFFHAEFFESEQGGFRALEINVRPPGGFTTDMMNYGANIDVYKLWAKVLTHQDLSGFSFERTFHVAHVGRRDELTYRVPHDEVVRAMGARLILTGPMPPILAGAMGDTFYMLRDPDEASLLKAIAMIEAMAQGGRSDGVGAVVDR